MSKQKLFEFLATHLTERRVTLFEKVLAKRTRHLTVAIEDLHKEHNASAVVRTCDIFGLQDVHIIENRNKHIVNKEITMGSEKWLDITRYDQEENNTQICIDKLKADGYKIIATTPHKDGCELGDFNINEPAAIFFGGEAEGLSDTVLEQADEYIKIPMHGFTESFNISVSAAIILHELTNRLHKTDIDWQLSEEAILDKKIEWCKRTMVDGDMVVERFYKEQKQSF